MTSDFETILCIVSVANGKMSDGELFFTSPEVLDVIKLCTANRIAVLGLELFEVRPEGYHTKKLSGYDQQLDKGPEKVEGWQEYVDRSNALASKFVRLNPTGDDHVYVLTTSSWREFCEIQDIKRQR
jgi:hypothetical protein